MPEGRQAEVYESFNGEWFVIVENENLAAKVYEWRDNATAYGPFDDAAEASTFLRSDIDDRVRYWVIPNTGDSPTVQYRRLMKEAEENLRKIRKERLRVV